MSLSFVKARPPKRLSDKVLRCDGETPRTRCHGGYVDEFMT